MDIHHALFWGCAVLCAAAELLILRAVFRQAPDAPPGGAGADPTVVVPHSSSGTEIFWGVLPLFALAAIFWAAWQALA